MEAEIKNETGASVTLALITLTDQSAAFKRH